MKDLLNDVLRSFFPPEEKTQLTEIRSLPSYKRLKEKFGSFSRDVGVDNFVFTVGDILDVADLYNNCVNTNNHESLRNIIEYGGKFY